MFMYLVMNNYIPQYLSVNLVFSCFNKYLIMNRVLITEWGDHGSYGEVERGEGGVRHRKKGWEALI